MQKILVIGILLFSTLFAAPKLKNSDIETEIKDMIFTTTRNLSYKVLSIPNPVNNLAAVAINPPYREFPNILLYQFKDNKWHRVFECLSIGIQDVPSDILDLHTVGDGVDVTIGGKTEYAFDDETKNLISKTLNSSSMLIIPYKNFLHMHMAGKHPYTIDKTKFLDLANKLHEYKYSKYPRDNCMMYDLPKLKIINLSYKSNKYLLECQTSNGQFWVVTFDGVDDNGQYLRNKEIQIK